MEEIFRKRIGFENRKKGSSHEQTDKVTNKNFSYSCGFV